MTADVRGALIALTGVIALRLGLTEEHLSYLKPSMRWPLVAAGAILLVLGATTYLRDARRARAGAAHDHHDGHDHHGGPPVAWLLALPVFAVMLVAPGALGAYAASRESTEVVVAEPATRTWEPLPAPRDGAVDLSLGDFLTRSYYDGSETLAGATVRLVGFVVRDDEIDDGYLLTRFQLSCCAADAFPVQVAVHGVEGEPPPDDTWVEVTGTWRPPPDGTVGVDRGAKIDLVSQQEIPEPTNPYA